MPPRCFHRHSTVAWYASDTAMITLRLDLDQTTSDEAVTHELVHHDLTELTVAGKLEQLLARGAADEGLHEEERRRLAEIREGLVTRSTNVHESAATYVAALGARVAGREPTPLAELLPFYRDAVTPLLRFLDDPYGGARVRFFTGQMLAASVARTALDGPDVIALLESRPASPVQLAEAFARIDADRIYVSLLEALCSEAGIRAELEQVLRTLARERLGVDDLPLLDAFLIEDDDARASFVPDADDRLIAALHARLPGIVGAFVPLERKSVMWGDFIRHCQTTLRDGNGRAYFHDVTVTGEIRDDFEPNFTYVFRSAEMDALWRHVRAPSVGSVADALAWLNDVASIAAPRGLRVVLHGRELIVHEDEGVVLNTGEVVPPRSGLLHLDLQLDRTRVDGSAISEEDVEALGSIRQSSTARPSSGEEERELFRIVEWMRFPVAWHAGWLAGLAAARVRPNPFAARPGVSLFYLDQSGATWKHFASVLERLGERGRVEVTRADVFEGASDAYVIREGNCYWSAVFPSLWLESQMRGFQAAHPDVADAALEVEDAARVEPFARYALHYVYDLARLDA